MDARKAFEELLRVQPTFKESKWKDAVFNRSLTDPNDYELESMSASWLGFQMALKVTGHLESDFTIEVSEPPKKNGE